MKTPKPGTPKRFIKIGTKNKQVCYILNKICLETVKEWKLSYLAEKTISQGWKKSYDELKIGYAKQSETLNDLSKEYNKLVGERTAVKQDNVFLIKLNNELVEKCEKLESDYLKATNAFVDERKQHKKDFKAVVIWAVINLAFAVSEICYIFYLLIK